MQHRNELVQTHISYDVYTSAPVDSHHADASWPGRPTRKLRQSSLDAYKRTPPPPTAAPSVVEGEPQTRPHRHPHAAPNSVAAAAAAAAAAASGVR